MATMGEFSSLLQLGFGIGIGLSIFRAPLELRSAYLARTIKEETDVIRGVNTLKAKAKQGALASIRLQFSEARDRLDRIQTPFMVATLLGALANLLLLIFASVSASRIVSLWEQVGLIGVSVGYYILIAVVLECVARSHLKAISTALENLRSSK